MKFLLVSVQLRVMVLTMPAGLPTVLTPIGYLPTLTLSAVLPLPNRSYDSPILTVTSLTLMPVTAGNVRLRFGTHMAGPSVCTG